MGAKGDLIFVILVVFAIGIVWVFTGGPERARLNPGIFLKPPAPLGSGETYGGVNISKSSIGLNLNGGDRAVRDEAVKVADNLDKIEQELEEAKIRGDFSQFENKIMIRKSTYGPKGTDAEDEYIELYASNRNNEKIAITGWTLESMISGKRFTIGGANEIYRSGIINSEPELKLAPNENVIISTGRSPVGASFRINKCIGYLEQFQDFYPSLSRSCPDPSDDFDSFAVLPANDFTCEDIVDRISQCEMRLNSLPIGTSNECSNFISNNISYTGCVKNHQNDLDFLGREWRVFLGRSEEIWRAKREIIRLLDTEGKIVDTYTY